MRRNLVFFCSMLSILVMLICFSQNDVIAPKFLIHTKAIVNPDITSVPYFTSELIPQPSYLKISHSSTLTKLQNGDLLSLWFAGSKEGQPDVKIFQSRYIGGQWTMSTPIISNYSLMHDAKRYISKLGNPVIYRGYNGSLFLFVVAVSVGGWGGSRIYQFRSGNDGLSWKFIGELKLKPFINVSSLVRTNPITLQDEGFYLPVYYEWARKYPFLLRFDKDGKFMYQSRMSNQNYMLQPSIVVVSDRNAFAYMRNSNAVNDNLYMLSTNDAGFTWSNPQLTNLKNPDSSLVVGNLGDELLMVYNIGATTGNRGKLALAISNDGVNWRYVKLLENYVGDEFSYPAIVITDNLIDITYTWSRKNIGHFIKHVRFNRAWLDAV